MELNGSIKAKGNITSERYCEGKDLKAGDVTVNKDNKGTVNGLSNKTWTRGQAPVSGQAATEDQIQAVDTRVMAGRRQSSGLRLDGEEQCYRHRSSNRQ